jgi:signal transduction histidine kinase
MRKAVKAERQRRREAAEMVIRAKSDFLANMSHELRTPLNAIIGFSELLMDGLQGPVNERQHEYLSGIHRSGSHLLAIVNDILDYAKIEAGRVELDERKVAVPALFHECAALLELQAANSGVEVAVAIDDATPPILGDERLLKQVLLNLLSNAVKFTAPGGRVTLSVRTIADGGMTLDISDTGIGMAPDEIEVALEAFRQVDSSLTRRHDGTGLGLPIAKRLTELHGAQLLFASQPHHGTTVSVRLPPWRVLPA